MNENKPSKYLRPIDDAEMKQWKSSPKSVTTELFESFLVSEHLMVEVKVEELPMREPKDQLKMKSTRVDRFASSFYAWKKNRVTQSRLCQDGIDIVLIRRGERVALKKIKGDSKR